MSNDCNKNYVYDFITLLIDKLSELENEKTDNRIRRTKKSS